MSQTLQGFKLSPQQRRIWSFRSREGAYLARATFSLGGKVDPERLRHAVLRVVERHEILRTVFSGATVLAAPLQAVAEPAPAFAAAPADGFDFERGPLVFFELAADGDAGARLTVTAPSLLLDSTSLSLLFAEVARAWAGEDSGEEPPLQYLEFCAWQSELLESGDDETLQAKAFWSRQELPAREEKLVGELAPGDLEGFSPGYADLEAPQGLEGELAAAASALGVSPRTVLLSAWMALVSRFTGNGAPVVGVAFDGRKFEDLSGALGPFTQSLPLRVRIEEAMAFRDLTARVAEAESEIRYWQEYAPWDLGFEQETARRVYPCLFDVEEPPGERTASGLIFSWGDRWICSEPFRFRLSCCRRPGGLRFRMGFDASVAGDGHARELGESYATLLRDALRRPSAPVGDLAVLGEAAFARLVVELNRAEALPDGPPLLHERFSEQAARRPEAVAVVDAEGELTFRELEARSNRLAHHLRSLGAGPETRVALWLDRSADLLAALLGALKSGAAYVPLDPSFPPERLALLVEEAGAPIVLTRSALAAGLPALSARVIVLEQEAEAIARCPAERPETGVLPANLAYVLFTSGSTGRPKGVAVEHRQVAAYLDAILLRMAPESHGSYATVSTFAADLGNTVIFPALATGGCLHVIGQEEARDPEALAARFAARPIDVLKIVPSHLEALLSAGSPERVLPRQRLVVGGEPASAGLVAELRRAASRGLRVLNHYGPTETTVGVMTHAVEAEGNAPLPLGRPLASARVHLLDSRLRPVPAGMPGEIYLGGAGVSRGYLGRPDLTAERFLPDPFGPPGERLYRSGDLARFRPGGDVEFIGRVDHQVKIRGFRIELAEVEATLRRHPDVREAVATVREDRPGERRLVGYIVPRKGAAALAPAELRAFAGRWLPEAMIPAAFHLLKVLPLTPNGKVDRAALPAPERQARTGEGDDAPRDAAEEALAAIWREVLGIERVGIHDNFFELGGDSILAIQVVARGGRAGLRFQPKQMFERQTIAELAAVAERAAESPVAEAEAVAEGPLTPIEHWFFAEGFADPHHWNQAALYEVGAGVRPDLVRSAFAAVYAHHDALRLRFEPAPSGWRQRIAETEPLPFEVVELPAAGFSDAAERVAAETQARLDLVHGPLVRAVFLDGGAAGPSRLLLVFHHLVIDGVSWRILVEDFVSAYEGLAAGKGVSLPARTTPFLRWAERLASFTEAGGFDDELPFWETGGEDLAPLPVDFAEGEVAIASQRSVASSLSAEETSALLQEVPAVYRTQINDVLLAALARVLCRFTGRDRVVVDLEGHGREDLFEGVDLTRTVGWFTTHFPVVLAGRPDDDPAATLVAAKESLRAVPRRGIGFGALRFLRGGAASERLRAIPQPQVSFNYLGQFDPAGSESPLFTRAPERAGPLRSPRGHSTHLLAVAGRIEGGVLEVVWRYSENRHRRERIEEVARGYLDELRRIIADGRSREEAVLSPSDFDLAAGLSREQLERIARQIGQAKV